jgi:hypothetical protein
MRCHDDAPTHRRPPVGRRFTTLGWGVVAGVLLSSVLVGNELGAQPMPDTVRSPTGRYLFTDTHINPSAGTLVVLARDRSKVAELPGWFLAAMGNDVVIYHRNQVHFAPTHALEIWTYDPVTRRDARLYPAREPASGTDSRLLDSVVVDRARHTATFRVERNGGQITVRCRAVGTNGSRCDETVVGTTGGSMDRPRAASGNARAQRSERLVESTPAMQVSSSLIRSSLR